MIRRWIIVLTAMVFLAGCGESSPPPPTRTATTKPVVTVAPESIMSGSVALTRDSRHIAYVVRTGDRQAAVVDGWEVGRYEEVRGLAFSLEGLRYAFIARDGRKSFLVADGKREPQDWAAIAWLRFSPDGKHVAYLASLGDAVDEASRASMVVDGKVVGTHKAVAEDSTLFSPDGTRFSYAALQADGRRVVFVDGQAGPAWEMAGLTAFSDDSRHVAYAAKEQGVYYIVVDGLRGPPLGGIFKAAPFRFRPGSGEVAYPAQVSGTWRMFTGGQWGPAYDMLSTPFFSKDGRRMAHVAQRGTHVRATSGEPEPAGLDEAVAVIDGQPGPAYASIASITFSDNGKSVGYTATSAKGALIVVNGKPLGPYKSVGAGEAPLWSPDGSRYAFAVSAEEEGKTCLVSGAGKGKAYDEIKGLKFSPCGKWLAYAARRGTAWCVVINGAEGEPHDDLLAEVGGGIAFDSPARVHYFVRDKSTFSFVEEELK